MDRLTVILTDREGQILATLITAASWAEVFWKVRESYALEKARRVRAYAGGLVVQL